MVGHHEADPVLDQVGLLLEDGEAGGSVVSVVPDLDLEAGGVLHQLQVARLEAEGVLEALGGLEEILLLLVNGGAGVPAEHAFHLALDERHLGHIDGLGVLAQSLQEQGLQCVGLGMVGMRLKQLLRVLEPFFIVLGVVEFLDK